MRESRDRCGQASEAGWEPEPRILSKGRSGVKKTETSHAARADTVPRPRKKRAGPPAGQLLRAEPDFGTGKNFVLPFPSAQGRMLSFYPELTEPARRPSTGRVVLLRPGGREPVCLSGEVNMARYGLPGAPPPAARPKTRSPRGAARGRPYPSHPYPSHPYPSHPFLAQGRRRGVLNALIPPPPGRSTGGAAAARRRRARRIRASRPPTRLVSTPKGAAGLSPRGRRAARARATAALPARARIVRVAAPPRSIPGAPAAGRAWCGRAGSAAAATASGAGANELSGDEARLSPAHRPRVSAYSC